MSAPNVYDDEEQALLRATVRAIMDRESVGAEDAAAAAYVQGALVDAGLMELRSPDEMGAAIATTATTLIVVEELGRCAAPGGYLGALLATELLRLCGATAAELEQLTVDAPVAVALSHDLVAFGQRGEIAVDCAVGATHALTLDGATLALAPLTVPVDMADPSRRMSEVGEPTALPYTMTPSTLESWTRFSELACAADLLGVASGALELARSHAAQRVQFGRVIASFQAVQHLCARAWTRVEAMRSAVLYGSWAHDHGSPDASVATRVAKAYASTAAREVVYTAMQVIGGMAMTWEHPAHRRLRRVLLDRRLFGDEAFHQAALANSRLAYHLEAS